MKKNTKIIATLGPSSNTPRVIKELKDAGVEYFRLNFSHGNHEWHKKTIATIKKVSPNTPIILDTKGPEMRTGDMPEHFPEVIVATNDILLLTGEKNLQNPEKNILFVNHPNLVNDVNSGDILSIDSGLIETRVESISADKQYITTKILHGGKISSRRHVNLVQKDVSLPTITSHDEEDIRFGLQNGIDIIALSFLRCKTGVETVKNIITEELGDKNTIKIWGKIESKEGVKNSSEIAQIADGLMVARGDLGVETPLEEVPYRQREILAAAQKHSITGIVATEMLESMTKNLRPTRAEVSDVALAVWEGANAVMLSGETANGKYPVETVQIMKKIIRAAENSGIDINLQNT